MYAELKVLHIACAVLSIVGFAARGWGMLHNAGWMRRRWVRILPHVIDTLLLASALGMAAQLGAGPWQSGWLTAKTLALCLYIVLGSIALRHGRTPAIRATAFAAALLVVLWIVAIALAKSAWGPLSWMMVV